MYLVGGEDRVDWLDVSSSSTIELLGGTDARCTDEDVRFAGALARLQLIVVVAPLLLRLIRSLSPTLLAFVFCSFWLTQVGRCVDVLIWTTTTTSTDVWFPLRRLAAAQQQIASNVKHDHVHSYSMVFILSISVLRLAVPFVLLHFRFLDTLTAAGIVGAFPSSSVLALASPESQIVGLTYLPTHHAPRQLR